MAEAPVARMCPGVPELVPGILTLETDSIWLVHQFCQCTVMQGYHSTHPFAATPSLFPSHGKKVNSLCR
jgi:hypothetical protein